jgi:ATP citrate (pro-S)-lyase
MSAKAIREYHGKLLIAKYIQQLSEGDNGSVIRIDDRAASVTSQTNFDELVVEKPWLLEVPLVVKPDQLIKRRGKAGLVGLNLSFQNCQGWIEERMDKEIQVDGVKGKLNHFIIEPFLPHSSEEEYYVCISSERAGDTILFSHEGGVDVGDVDAKAERMVVDIGPMELSEEAVIANLLTHVPQLKQAPLARFLNYLFKIYRMLNFTYMEINPLAMTVDRTALNNSSYVITPLDLAAKIDETASFLCSSMWGHLDFPPAFGREDYPEEAYIRELDGKTGASLKLTILNPHGRIWTMVAGGGASVV